jgi:hypothetical protein
LQCRFVAAVVFGMACISAPALAEKRIALVIGNSGYQNVARLDNPKNDAGLMARTLRGQKSKPGTIAKSRERSSPVVPTFGAASQGFQYLGVTHPPQLVKSG